MDDTQLPYLKDRLLRADAQDISIIRQSLAGHKDTLVAECWRVLEKPEQEDQGKALQAASALALYDSENPLWGKIRTDAANRLVAENAYVVSRWVDALRPVAKQFDDPLIAIFRDEKRGESERTQAASALAEYMSDQPRDLAGLLMDATETQFVALYPGVGSRSDQTAPLFEEELSRKPPSVTKRYSTEITDLDSKVWDMFYKRQANAAVALIRMGRTDKSWPLLKHSPDPSLRSYLVHRLGPLGVEPGLLIAKLDQESDVSIRRALGLSLGEYEQARISTREQDALTTKLLNLYRNDPDPGIHGASEWLLHQWRNDSQIQGIDKELGKLPPPTDPGIHGASEWLLRQLLNENQIQGIDKELGKLPPPTLSVDEGEASSKRNNRRWYINSQGQTMVVVRGPVEFEMGEGFDRHREPIGHSFAIASKEVTVEQFETFVRENPRVQVKESKFDSCPF